MAPENDLSLDQIDDASPTAPRDLRSYAERKDAAAAAATAENEKLKKELAVLRAGIDVSTRKGQAWMQATDADFDDIEALRKDALEFDPTIVAGASGGNAEGGANGDQAPEGNQTDQNTQTSSGAQIHLQDGSIPSGAAIEDILTSSLDNARKAIDAGAEEEFAMGALVAARARGVHEGKLQPLLPNGTRPVQGL